MHKKSIPILIGIIGLLIILLAGCIGYIMGNFDVLSKNKTSNFSTVDNSKVLQQIDELKLMYDSKIADKTLSYNSLQVQKDSIASLVIALEQSKSDANSLIKYKTQFKSLESKMKILVNEIVILKNKKSNFFEKKQPQKINLIEPKVISDIPVLRSENIVIKNDITLNKKEVQISKNENLKPKQDGFFDKIATTKIESQIAKPEVVSKKVDKSSNVSLSNLKVTAIISKSATKKVETNQADKTDLILIQFTITGNDAVKEGEKLYYFQIIDGKNNVLGKRVTQYFDNESLTYSFSKSFSYETKSVNISQEFLSEKFVKGTYRVNIYDRDVLVCKTTFSLQ